MLPTSIWCPIATFILLSGPSWVRTQSALPPAVSPSPQLEITSSLLTLQRSVLGRVAKVSVFLELRSMA